MRRALAIGQDVADVLGRDVPATALDRAQARWRSRDALSHDWAPGTVFGCPIRQFSFSAHQERIDVTSFGSTGEMFYVPDAPPRIQMSFEVEGRPSFASFDTRPFHVDCAVRGYHLFGPVYVTGLSTECNVDGTVTTWVEAEGGSGFSMQEL